MEEREGRWVGLIPSQTKNADVEIGNLLHKPSLLFLFSVLISPNNFFIYLIILIHQLFFYEPRVPSRSYIQNSFCDKRCTR